jgi:hypothetical protein
MLPSSTGAIEPPYRTMTASNVQYRHIPHPANKKADDGKESSAF